MTDLRAAYGVCRRINATHGKSFYRATSLLPPARRRHVWALYAVARRSDDLVDRPAIDVDPATSLRRWRTEVLDAITAGATPTDPVLVALQHTVGQFEIRATLFEEFFASMQQDLTVTRYERWEDLRRYMRGSAAAIGEMTAPVLGGPPSSLPFAATLGEAFQLTNFVRDVAEDLLRGRIYLPLEDLRSCGLTIDELGSCVATGASSPPMVRLVALQIARARTLYDAAAPGIGQLDPVVRPCLRAAFTLYGQILTQIEHHGHEVCAGRVVVPPTRRARALSRAMIARHLERTTSATTRW